MTTTQNCTSIWAWSLLSNYHFDSCSHEQYISHPLHCWYLLCSTVHMEEKPYMLRIGSLLVHNFGQLLPYQIQTNKFNTRDSIYPVSSKVHLRASLIYISVIWVIYHSEMFKSLWFVCSVDVSDGYQQKKCLDSEMGGVVWDLANWAQWLSGRILCSQSREPGFELSLLLFRSLGIFVLSTMPQFTINGCLAIESCGNVNE